MTRHSMVSRKMIALAMAGALLLLALPGLAGIALAQDIPEDLPLESGHDFVNWLMEPMSVTMLVLEP